IAVAGEAQDRLTIVILDMRGDPHLARAALHLVGGRALAFIEGRQATAKLDDIPVAILPFLEDGKIIGQRRDARRYAKLCHAAEIGARPDDLKQCQLFLGGSGLRQSGTRSSTFRVFCEGAREFAASRGKRACSGAVSEASRALGVLLASFAHS